MTPSEYQFVTLLAFISGISYLVHIVTQKLFYKTLSVTDKETLEKRLDRPLRNRSKLLAGICFISFLYFFFHSAILGAILVKEYIL